MYPNRSVFFGIETGLIDPDEYAAKIEAENHYRFLCYLYGFPLELFVEPLEDFKERFGI